MVVCTYSFLYTVFILYCGCWYPFPVGMYVVVTLSNWLNIYIYILLWLYNAGWSTSYFSAHVTKTNFLLIKFFL